MRRLTYAGKLAAALGLMVMLTATVGIFAVYSLQMTVRSKDAVINVDADNLALTERLERLVQQQRAVIRDYLLASNQTFLAELQQARRDTDETMRRLEDNGVIEIRSLREADRTYTAQVDRLLQARRDGGTSAAGAAALEQAVSARVLVEQSVSGLLTQQQRRLDQHRQEATDIARNARQYIIAGVLLAFVAGLLAAWSLRRTLTLQIGSAVEHVQSSSAELQAAANQQASGSKQQATAMTEITTTMTELLATSRQIAESAQRVARVAEETSSAGRSGDLTVQEGGESISSIKRQVDAIVSHMLDLGRRSQEIGGVLDIITELAEQTNILAVNAAIEAAGAGESGRRFGVVAEEIRKLADRVSGSAKEIRILIQEVRAAVNASVMTTETAAKTVDAGAERFGHVSTAFREIATLVRTTNDAAREIELSTKQQTSAVEQVNRGIADVAQAAKETEVTSTQMLKTVSELASLSLDLSLLIRAEPLA